MFSKSGKKIIAIVLSLAMAATLGAGFTPAAKEGKVAKAALSDEGSSGLTHVESLDVESPDGKVAVKIWKNSSNAYYYSAYLNDYTVVQCSAFGLTLSGNDLSTGMTLDEDSIDIVEGEDDYDIVMGPVNHVKKQYNELQFDLTKGNAVVTMNFRVSNDGVGFRYVVDADTTQNNENVTITAEKSAFTFPDSGIIWHTDRSATYEAGSWYQKPMSQVRSSNATYGSPILCATGADGGNAWVLITDSAVFCKEDAYVASVFQTSSNSKEIRVRWGENLNGEDNLNNHGAQMGRSHTWVSQINYKGGFETPWRAIIIGEDANAVMSSTLVSDLNPPAEGDFSWVVPGTSVWSWWSTQSDAIDYDSMFDYIDFCSAAGITYCLVDYGWEIWSDYDNKVKALVEYADERNVGLLLWFGVHKWDARHVIDLDNQADIEQWTSWCEDRGVKGMKVDYIESDSQFAMKNMYWITEACARHHLVLNFHGATDPNGENRTFPNLLSIEAVQGMEYFKWSNASSPNTLCALPYARNVIGSMEYTPALMSIPRSPATSGFMLSMCITYESAVQTWSQSGYVYPGYSAFSLIADVPSTWDESILLEGYPMRDCVRARRNGENWYLGAMTVDRRSYDIPLDFLDDDAVYHTYIYRDNADGSGIIVEEDEYTSEDTFSFDLLANGGIAVKFTKEDPIKWTLYDNFNFYEAENAQRSGNASVNGNQAYVSGKAYVQGIGNGANNSVTFNNVEVKEDGDYQLKIYVVSPQSRSLTVEVNGQVAATQNIIGISGDGGAVGANKGYIDIPLNEGSNTIKLYSTAGSGPSIDRIAVSKTLIDEENSEVTLSQDEYTFDGKECVPEVKVVRDGEELTQGEQYSVFYSNNKKAGTASVYIRGINGYGGQIIKEFSIKAPYVPAEEPTTQDPTVNPNPNNGGTTVNNPGTGTTTTTPAAVTKPGKVSIGSAKAGKKKITVKFKKVDGADGYQLLYGLKKNFKGAKKVNLKATATSKVLKKLKAKKKYFIRIRAYKLDGSTKVWGAYSKVKKVKVK